MPPRSRSMTARTWYLPGFRSNGLRYCVADASSVSGSPGFQFVTSLYSPGSGLNQLIAPSSGVDWLRMNTNTRPVNGASSAVLSKVSLKSRGFGSANAGELTKAIMKNGKTSVNRFIGDLGEYRYAERRLVFEPHSMIVKTMTKAMAVRIQ